MTRKPAFAILHTLLSLTISLCLACTRQGDASVACPVVEMSAVTDTQTDSSRTVTMDDTTTIRILRTPLTTTGDITSAGASQAKDKWVVDFTVTDDVARRVHDFTAQHVGGHLALVVDGKVHGTPRIAGAIAGNKYQIDGLTRADAERVATAISNGCRTMDARAR